MADFNKFEQFVADLGKGVHQLHAAGHTLKVYLTNATPSESGDVVLADLAGITEENGYAAADITNDYTEAAGVGTLTGTDVVWTASGGTFGPFRYIVIYNDTPTSPADPLVCYWDYGAEITIQEGYPFTVNFGDSILTIT